MLEDLPMKSIGWGIMGCGRIATNAVAPAINWSANGHLVAVASRDRNVAAAKARELGAARAYAPYEAMLGDPDVDAVYIGLPNGLHEEWAVRCAQAGKHVLCEKSLTMTLASARRMAAAFAPRGLRLVDAFMYRHHPQWSLVRSLLDERAIGKLCMLRVGFCYRLDNADDHRWSAALGGGALWDLTCYGVNVARFVTKAEPVRVAAFADSRTPQRVDALTQVSLELADGVLASLTGSMRGGSDQSVIIDGDQGTLELSRAFLPRWDPTCVVLRRPGRVPEERRIEVEGANEYLHEVEHFASLVLDPTRPAWPAEDGVGNVATCEAIERSWRTGTYVAVEGPLL
jgi:D-xylose 1-dehydrogenase (NADP+, D-xylono-1,5-lactone-forming)